MYKRQGLPDLAAGNFFGSSMINMPLLAVIDLFYRQTPLFLSLIHISEPTRPY